MVNLLYTRLLTPFLLLVCTFGAQASAQMVDESVDGKTFAISGPNCFAAALRITGNYPTFRAVGPQEFSAYLELTCEKVDTPQKGDIGAYFYPGYTYSHAYVHIDDEFGMDKPGVDYMGPTPVAKKRFASIDYIHYASRECRQYSKDISACSSQRALFRCRKMDWSQHPELLQHNTSVRQWEEQTAIVLEQPFPLDELAQAESALQLKMVELEDQWNTLQKLPLNEKIKNFLDGRMRSLRGQMEFIKLKVNALKNR